MIVQTVLLSFFFFFFSFYFLDASQSDNNNKRVYDLGQKYVLAFHSQSCTQNL